MARNVFQQNLEDEASNRIQVAGKRVAAHPQGFQRD
jgi:hypothetical protein